MMIKMDEKLKKKYSLYKKIFSISMYIMIIIFILSTTFLIYKYNTTGTLFLKDITLSGGVSISFFSEKKVDINLLEQEVQNIIGEQIVIRETKSSNGYGYFIESTIQDQNKINEVIDYITKNYNLKKEQVSIQFIGETLGKSFFKEAFYALIFAFLLMAIVVYIIFRQPLPSFYVVFAAFADIVETIVITNLLGIKISIGGIAAFLMLLGYSVDTDILLTTKLLKTKGKELYEKTFMAMKTGLTMSITTLVATLAGFLLSNNPIIKQIMLIIFIGILLDILNTWLFNAPILIKTLEKKQKTK